MKPVLTLILFTLVTISRSQEIPIGMVSIENNHHDFGYVMENEGSVSYRFNLTNTGTAPFSISRVRTICNCTSPSWTKTPIAPGEQGYVEIAFNPAGYDGAFHKTILIQSTASNSDMFLTVSGKVLPSIPKDELNFQLGSLKVKKNQINMGYLYKGTDAVERIPVYNPTNTELKLTFEQVPEYITLTTIPETLQPDQFGYIEITYCPGKTDQWHIVVDSVLARINGQKTDHDALTLVACIREDFRGMTTEQLAAAPTVHYSQDTILFPNITKDQPQPCSFDLTNQGQSDLIIRAIIPSCGCTVATPEKQVLKPGESAKIEAVYDPPTRKGLMRNSIIVITNDPKQAEKQLFINAYVNIPPP